MKKELTHLKLKRIRLKLNLNSLMTEFSYRAHGRTQSNTMNCLTYLKKLLFLIET